MESPDALSRVQLLASRAQLDSGQVYHEQKIFKTSVEKCNDKQLPAGGLVQIHEAYVERKINPDVADERRINYGKGMEDLHAGEERLRRGEAKISRVWSTQ